MVHYNAPKILCVQCDNPEIPGFLCRRGIVTQAMLDTRAAHKLRFATIGLFEALFKLFLFEAVAHLPGAVLPLLAQSLLVWNFLLSAIVLRKRYDALLMRLLITRMATSCTCFLMP
jgi:hypothetical protein